ncbi:MAG: hypothetical protein ABR865_15350 [Terracidiphilus sp.]|jgi:hypothetical protein
MTVTLVRYDAAKRALAAASRVDEAKKIRDRAEAVRVYAVQARDYDLQNRAATIRLLAERRAGQLLADMEKNPGTRGDGRPRKDGSKKRRYSRDTAKPPTLEELNISKVQSSKWQRLARLVDDDTFEEALSRAKDIFGELTTAGMLRMLKEVVRPKSTRTDYDINEVADDLVREIERRHERLNAVVENKERLNPTLRRKLITALEHESKVAKELSDGFKDFENNGKAYQRIVRERLAQLPEPNLEEKKRLASTLKNATIREISYHDARGLILQNEWLATVGSAEFFFGLYFGEFLGGCVAFGSTAGTNAAASVLGERYKHTVTTLVRGLCCSWAHEHSGSFLVAGACREMAKKGYHTVLAYSDVEAGEQGVIMRATNFLFCGETGATERFKTPDGRVRDSRLVSGYTRDRTGGTLKYKRTRAEQKKIMLEDGVEFFRGTPKLRWVGFFGSKTLKRRLRAALQWPVLPYPKRSTVEEPVQLEQVGISA